MKSKLDYSLYLCTDSALMSTPTIEEAVEQAILGGCTCIQLREKTCSSLSFFETACRVKAITEKFHVPLIINDRVDIALAVNADGVHIGQSDLPCVTVRKMIGQDKIIGVSASSVEEAIQAEKDGADYLGVGAMYATGTKTDARVVTIEQLKEIRLAVKIPIVVIGGINKNTLENFRGYADGLAVVSAIISQKDIRGAARELLQLFKGKQAPV
jgi:thiamine-phosphate pyrophosphorylase